MLEHSIAVINRVISLFSSRVYQAHTNRRENLLSDIAGSWHGRRRFPSRWQAESTAHTSRRETLLSDIAGPWYSRNRSRVQPLGARPCQITSRPEILLFDRGDLSHRAQVHRIVSASNSADVHCDTESPLSSIHDSFHLLSLGPDQDLYLIAFTVANHREIYDWRPPTFTDRTLQIDHIAGALGIHCDDCVVRISQVALTNSERC